MKFCHVRKNAGLTRLIASGIMYLSDVVPRLIPSIHHKTMRINQLELEVATRNRVNQKAIECKIALQEALKPFIGKKVIKYNPYKTWTAAVKAKLDEVQKQLRLAEDKFRLVYDISVSIVWITVDCTYDIPGTCACQYVKRDIAICAIDGDILADLTDDTIQPRTDYTIQEVTDNIKRMEELREEISKVRSAMVDFEDVYHFNR